ncbi:MAG: glutathione S-transferase family protein [Hyphomicrobiaceae bacterium]|nr:glutathione S-transferase family protein [Hyphomicrobiaceae bacterium]
MKLIIGNKNYSSWSMRPWLVARHFRIAFDEILIPLDMPDTRAKVLAWSPSGKVPCMVDGDVTVWETLAIIETLAERHPDLPIWPRDPAARAHARAISNEMHAGFAALRTACPMNLKAQKPWKPRGGEAAAKDVARILANWREARHRFGAGGPFLYGAFSAADAMYAPVTTRLTTYSWPMDDDIRAYVDAVQSTEAFVDWKTAGLAETWVTSSEEVD